MSRMFVMFCVVFVLLQDGLVIAQDNHLSVTVRGLKQSGGMLIVALFRNGENWLDTENAYRLKRTTVNAEQLQLVFDSMEPGEYAVYVFHDENDNNKFDMRWLPWPKPKEGAGVSGNKQRNGPPDYESAKFSFTGSSQQINVNLYYY